jgi:hypothetical protein
VGEGLLVGVNLLMGFLKLLSEEEEEPEEEYMEDSSLGGAARKTPSSLVAKNLGS